MSERALIREIADLISATIDSSLHEGAEFWTKLDLTMPQLKILMLLGEASGVSVSWLATRLDVSPPNITGILDRLEQHGWVQRANDARDRRVVRVVLTPRSEQLLKDLHRTGEVRLIQVLVGMNDEDQLALRQGLEGLLSSIRASDGLDARAAARTRVAGIPRTVA
ncbi:MAG: MarR family transcriptional regulator [Dehalococcoidia bacterium]